MRSIFIGGKQIGFNCLMELYTRRNNYTEIHKPELVIANLDDEGKDTWHLSLVKLAKQLDMNVMVGVPVKKLVEEIKAINPDIIFCIGGMQIIPKEILDIAPVVNLHPALLPKYRGRYSTVHAIFNGETETGVTLHYMDEGMDSGPIISQRAFPITDEDTGKTVYDNFTKHGTELFRDFIADLFEGKEIVSTPQDESQATYYPKGLPNDGKLDLSWSPEQKDRFIRAMTFPPFPLPS